MTSLKDAPPEFWYYIANSLGNVTANGGIPRSAAEKKFLSEWNRGEGHPQFGIPLAEPRRKKISKSLKNKHCSPKTEWKKGQHGSTKTEWKKGEHGNTKTEFAPGNPGYWLGKPRSEETRKKISKSLKGLVPWNKGLKLSEQHKKKVSEGLKRYFEAKNL